MNSYDLIRTILETALHTEAADLACYQRAAQLTQDEAARMVLERLIETQEAHCRMLSKKSRIYGGSGEAPYELAPSDEARAELLANRDCKTLLAHCLESERRRARQFEDAARQCNDSVVRQFLVFLADREHEQVALLERFRDDCPSRQQPSEADATE